MDVLGFFNDPAGNAVLIALGLVAVRLVLGVWAAISDGTFVLSSLAAFARTQVLGRVFPFATVAYFAWATQNVALYTSAAAIGAAFVAETVGAIQEALSNTAKAEVAEKETRALAKGNPVPQD
jgi:hypothetical protein